jgi:hypothetical protein
MMTDEQYTEDGGGTMSRMSELHAEREQYRRAAWDAEGDAIDLSESVHTMHQRGACEMSYPKATSIIALYVGVDGWNRPRTAEVPLPADLTPSKHITRLGILMELKAVLSREDVENAESLNALAGLERRRA